MSDYYISPKGSGDHSGSSWSNAATINKLGALINKAGPDDEILIRADQGDYHVTSQIAIHAGGSAGKPVTIRGVDGAGNSQQAVITGNRPASYTGGVDAGNELFKLLDGADNLKFKDLMVKNTGTVFRFGDDITRITIDNVDARNVQYFANTLSSGTATSATVDKLTIRDSDVIGFSNKAIYLAYNTSDVKIENVTVDMAGQKGARYPEGIHLAGKVHDVVIRDTTVSNVQATGGANQYWNGDAFATEGSVHHVRFENTLATGSTDAGYDLKSSHTVLDGAVADDNTRNFRIWNSAELIDVEGYDPHKRGGSSQQAQVWIGENAKVAIHDGLFSDSSRNTTVFTGTGGSISFDDVTTEHATGTLLNGLYRSNVSGMGTVDDHFVYPNSVSTDTI